MEAQSYSNSVSWTCKNTWKKASVNTLWCLAGCSIGDIGTIAVFQYYSIPWPTLAIMSLAVINGLITSIMLETIILSRQMVFRQAFHTAIGMSFISMVAMECSMNLVDWILMGSAKLNLITIFVMLIAGFLTPLPYNYWRLKALGKACH